MVLKGMLTGFNHSLQRGDLSLDTRDFACSELDKVQHGAPQGIVCGPPIFRMCISDLPISVQSQNLSLLILYFSLLLH
jgi:hypothetical protein